MNINECRTRAHQTRSARLATSRPAGGIDLVPIVFAFVGDDLVFAIDHKPKTTQRLQRLENIAADPQVTLLFDHYDDDWNQLWWVRMYGIAKETDDPDERTAALDALAAKYPQHAEQRPEGSVVWIRPTDWSGWSYSA